MIGYLKGEILKKDPDRVLLLVNNIGYEVFLPAMVAAQLNEKETGDELALFIYTHQTEKQPKPLLIGFMDENEKAFFERFLTVEDIGPVKAVGALCVPIGEIAGAIEQRDAKTLTKLKGIGKRTAEKIVATLHGKMEPFVCGTLFVESAPAKKTLQEPGFVAQVLEVMVGQLGHKLVEAKDMVNRALAKNPEIQTPEALLEEVYRKET